MTSSESSVAPYGEGNDAIQTESISRSAIVFPLVAAFLAVGLRAAFLTSQSLWLDEGFTLEHADTGSLAETFRRVLDSRSTERFSPLYPVLLHGVIQWFGDSVIVLRGFSVICGIGAVGVLVMAAFRLFDRPTGVLTAFLVSMSAYAVWYSQDARLYSMMLLLVGLQILSLAWCSQPPPDPYLQSRRWALAFVSGIGLFGNVLFAISSASLSLAHLAVGTDRRSWWRLWWPAAAASLPALIFFAASPVARAPGEAGVSHLHQSAVMNFIYTIYGQLVGITFGAPQVSLRGPDKLAVLRQYPTQLFLAGLLAFLLLMVVAAVLWNRQGSVQRWRNHALLGLSVLIGAALSVAFVLGTHLNWQPRHGYFLFPPAILFIAFSLRELIRSGTSPLRALAVVTLGLFLLTNLWSLYNAVVIPAYGKDDYRGAAHFLTRNRRLGETSVLLLGKSVLLRYYGDTATVDLTILDQGSVIPVLRELSRSSGDVLVAINREFYWREGVPASEVFDSAFKVGDHKKLQYFDIYRLSARE